MDKETKQESIDTGINRLNRETNARLDQQRLHSFWEDERSPIDETEWELPLPVSISSHMVKIYEGEKNHGKS